MIGSYGAVMDYLIKEFGGLIRYIPATSTVIGAAGQTAIVPADPERIWICFVAIGTADIAHMSPDQLQLGITGIPVAGNAGVLQFDVRFDAIMPTLAWSAISEVGAMTIVTFQLRRDVRINRETQQ